MLIAYILISIFISTGMYAITGLLLGIKADEVLIFAGPKIIRFQVINIPLSIGILPISGHVRFNEDVLKSMPTYTYLILVLSMPLLFLLLGLLMVFDFRQGIDIWLSGFVQPIIGAWSPSTVGVALITRAFQLHGVEGLGVVMLKMSAFNLIPLPCFNGGLVIGRLFRIPEKAYNLAGVFIFLLMWLGIFFWLYALYCWYMLPHA